jgi:glycosyltransferase involved in cell wall biosynthesis
VPVRNCERFIAECLESVLAQTHPVHEVIVVNDGSTDGTSKVLTRFRDRIRVVETPCRGVSAARNRGIEAADGEVIAFLDADDIWLPNKVQSQLAALALAGDTPAAAHTGYIVADEALRPVQVVRCQRDSAGSVRSALLVEGPGVGFSFTGMVSRRAVERVGGFDERLSVSSDIDFVCRVARSCLLVGTADLLSVHRRHRGPQMHRDLDGFERDMRVVLTRARDAGMPQRLVRRGLANVDAYAAARRLADRRSAAAAVRLMRAASVDPSGSARMAMSILTDRAVQRRQARRLGARLG